MAKMEGLAHIGVFITDIERSKKFYEDVLDFETIWECGVEEKDGTVTNVAFVKNGAWCWSWCARRIRKSGRTAG